MLAGHSCGGLLAQLFAFWHLDQVAGLVLVDPADEEILAAIPWPMRAVMSVPRHVALLAYRFGLLGRVIRGAVSDSHLRGVEVTSGEGLEETFDWEVNRRSA